MKGILESLEHINQVSLDAINRLQMLSELALHKCKFLHRPLIVCLQNSSGFCQRTNPTKNSITKSRFRKSVLHTVLKVLHLMQVIVINYLNYHFSKGQRPRGFHFLPHATAFNDFIRLLFPTSKEKLSYSFKFSY